MKLARRSRYHVFLILLSLTLSACGSQAPQVQPQLEFEVISPEEQVAQSLAETPKSFVVQYSEAQHTEERLAYFFRNYTAGAQETDEQGPSSATVITNKIDSNTNFLYTIERTVNASGYQYIVHCEGLSNEFQPAADRNARNLARFLREGQLEVSLLTR